MKRVIGVVHVSTVGVVGQNSNARGVRLESEF